MKQVYLLVLLLATASFFQIGCADVRFSSDFKANKKNEPPGGEPPGEPPGNPEDCCEQDFTYAEQEEIAKLDLLFVTDTSGSLNNEREAVANGLADYVANLEAQSDVDYNIAVMLAHGSENKDSSGKLYAGHLYQAGSEDLVIKKSDGQPINVQTDALKTKLLNVVEDNQTDGGEAGLYSTYKLLDAANVAEAQLNDFLRADAALAIVYISDENDFCAVFPDGVQRVPDPNGKEDDPATLQTLCEDTNITAQSIYDDLVALKGEQKLLVGSVIYTGQNPVPSQGENEIGYGYNDVTALAGNMGLQVDIAGNDIAGGMGTFGQLSGAALGDNVFILNRPNAGEVADGYSVDPASIVVRITGGGVTNSFDANSGAFTYDAVTNSVTVSSDLLEDGDAVNITYEITQ